MRICPECHFHTIPDHATRANCCRHCSDNPPFGAPRMLAKLVIAVPVVWLIIILGFHFYA